MKTYCYRKLTEFGINPLTGEACAYSQRILCDLNEDGVKLMTEYWGVKDDAFPENWNVRVGTKAAVASVMIDRHAFTNIIIFACLLKGWKYVIVRQNSEQVTVTNEDHEMEAWRELDMPDIRILINSHPHTPAVNSRNIHQMSGRYL